MVGGWGIGEGGGAGEENRGVHFCFIVLFFVFQTTYGKAICPACGPQDGGMDIAESMVFDVDIIFCEESMFVGVVFQVYEMLSGSNGRDGMLWFWAKDMDTFCSVSCGILM